MRVWSGGTAELQIISSKAAVRVAHTGEPVRHRLSTAFRTRIPLPRCRGPDKIRVVVGKHMFTGALSSMRVIEWNGIEVNGFRTPIQVR